jgi:hypothetical protein
MGGVFDPTGTGAGGKDTNGVTWGCSEPAGQPKTIAKGLRGLLAVRGDTVFVAREGLIGEDGVASSLVVVPLSCDPGSVVDLGFQHITCITQDASALYIGGDEVRAFTNAAQLVDLVAPSSRAVGVAVDASYVYWATIDGTIAKAPLAGGGATVLVTGEGSPSGVAVGSTQVYWTESTAGTVRAVPASGGVPVSIASGLSNPRSIVADAEGVYWAVDDAIWKLPANGGAATMLAGALASPHELATDGKDVYFSETTSPDPGSDRIARVSSQGGAVTVVASGLGQVSAIAVDATNAYWLAGETLQTAPK